MKCLHFNIKKIFSYPSCKTLLYICFVFFPWVEDRRGSKTSLATNNLGMMLERGFGSQNTLSAEYRPVMEELEETLSNIMAPKMGKRMHIPVVRILDFQVWFTGMQFVQFIRKHLTWTKTNLNIIIVLFCAG